VTFPKVCVSCCAFREHRTAAGTEPEVLKVSIHTGACVVARMPINIVTKRSVARALAGAAMAPRHSGRRSRGDAVRSGRAYLTVDFRSETRAERERFSLVFPAKNFEKLLVRGAS
jgi:hypothetical protein